MPGGGFAKTDTPATWSTFSEVMAAAERRADLGVGFVFSRDDPFTGIDLDDCLLPDGTLKPWAKAILERFGDTYAEISPSGRGIKLWITAGLDGLLTGTGTRRPFDDGVVEVYWRGRFFAVTGKRFNDSPLAIVEHRSSVEWLLHLIGTSVAAPDAQLEVTAAGSVQSRRDVGADELATLEAKLASARASIPKFEDLWLGGACGYWSGGKPDPSRADLAFCNILAFHLELDAVAIDVAFRMSERMRPKWDERHYADGATYGQRTVQKAVEWADAERQRCRTTARDVSMASAAGEARIEDLNSLPIFAGVKIAWERFERTDNFVFGYTQGRRVKWDGVADLLSFSKSQAAIAKYLGTVLLTPPRARIKSTWEPAAQLILQLATVVNRGDDMQVEVAELIPMCFRRAASPVARSDSDVFQFMMQIREWRRDPYSGEGIAGGSAPAPFVFVFDGNVFVNAHKLRLWASLPRVANTGLRKGEVGRELETLGFRYVRQFERKHEGRRIQMDLWRGPLEALGESLDEDDIPGDETKREIQSETPSGQ